MNPSTAVFPVAGLCTRSLPATKSISTEMLQIVDRAITQYETDEAGCATLIFVICRAKRAVEGRFDRAPQLGAAHEAKGKTEALEAATRDIVPPDAICGYRFSGKSFNRGNMDGFLTANSDLGLH